MLVFKSFENSNTVFEVLTREISRDVESQYLQVEPVSGSIVHLRAVTLQIIASPFTIQFCVTVHSRWINFYRPLASNNIYLHWTFSYIVFSLKKSIGIKWDLHWWDVCMVTYQRSSIMLIYCSTSEIFDILSNQHINSYYY